MENIKTLSDDLLVSRYSRGDNKAFDQLLDRHSKRVINYIYSLVQDRNLADDLFQDTMIKAITTIQNGRYQANGKFISWIFRIAHNLVIDHFRHTKTDRESLQRQTDIGMEDILCIKDMGLEEYWKQENLHRAINHLVDMLPDSQREIIRLRFDHNMSFQEIANHTGTKINTALGRMRYALINIRKLAQEREIVCY